MINENDIRRHIIAALLNEPILGQNYVDYHNENDECCVRIMYPSKQFDIIIKEVPQLIVEVEQKKTVTREV